MFREILHADWLKRAVTNMKCDLHYLDSLFFDVRDHLISKVQARRRRRDRTTLLCEYGLVAVLSLSSAPSLRFM